MAKQSFIRILTGAILVMIASSCATEKDYLVTIDTKYGKMYAILYDETPVHKENFIDLASSGRYDSTSFYRIIEDFMIQGGDVFNKEEMNQEDWYTLPAEFDENLIHEKGSLAAARQGDNINPEMRSSGCQFYIVEGKVYDETALTTDIRKLQKAFSKYLQLDSNSELREKYSDLYQKGEYDSINSLMLSNKIVLEKFFNLNLGLDKRNNQIQAYTTVGGTPHLDDTYTVFGKVIKGLDVLDEIASLETAGSSTPITPVYMKVNVELISKKKIAREYGYQYPQK
ncbi:peptidylprolyl isomerase [Cyclobacterium qasimii]|uniref:Peptidyl-prolyl cis-trans isomerase n=2 Tax=Cyclobacterium qasimii TaxID=1350429 RepID=S7V884_9BACT|nr:peptidylprolyl isomerase [Cyclobacterium qasimii]EPR65772.1 Peptidyl-prolyl cis-trans isomerase [Cyclobacterium qasimii M12-11B]GEO21697.1 peptidyl-prolyl cis-trans isomerase [Cyclobacterium qasimii]